MKASTARRSPEPFDTEMERLIARIVAAWSAPGRAAVERRGAERRRVLLPATIEAPGAAPRPCLVCDLSRTGARLALARGAALPSEMRLLVEGGPPRRVSLRWRRGDFAGVEFW